MRPPLRSVPWYKPPSDFHRPTRRVSPKRDARGIWTFGPDGWRDRLGLWFLWHWRALIRLALAVVAFGLLAFGMGFLVVWFGRAS